MTRSDFPRLGFGVGLRRPHYTHVVEQHPQIGWFEVISENFNRLLQRWLADGVLVGTSTSAPA